MLFLSCYSLLKNNCSGACQGCSDCPLCSLYHDGVTNKKFKRVNRVEMVKFALKTHLEHLSLSIRYALNDKKIKRILKDLNKRKSDNP